MQVLLVMLTTGKLHNRLGRQQAPLRPGCSCGLLAGRGSLTQVTHRVSPRSTLEATMPAAHGHGRPARRQLDTSAIGTTPAEGAAAGGLRATPQQCSAASAAMLVSGGGGMGAGLPLAADRSVMHR